jgi:hypothetical protein
MLTLAFEGAPRSALSKRSCMSNIQLGISPCNCTRVMWCDKIQRLRCGDASETWNEPSGSTSRVRASRHTLEATVSTIAFSQAWATLPQTTTRSPLPKPADVLLKGTGFVNPRIQSILYRGVAVASS